MENVTSFKSVGLAPLPIMDADRPLYDALDLLRPGNARYTNFHAHWLGIYCANLNIEWH